MVERFNGRIEEVLQSHHFRSGEDLATTLHRYVWLTNQQLPQSALGSTSPLQAMKDWQKLKPQLFRKQPYYLPGCDIYMPTKECRNAGHGAEYGNTVGSPQPEMSLSCRKDSTSFNATMWIKSGGNEGIKVQIPAGNDLVRELRSMKRAVSADIPGLAGIW
jgi:hypothetical protein